MATDIDIILWTFGRSHILTWSRVRNAMFLFINFGLVKAHDTMDLNKHLLVIKCKFNLPNISQHLNNIYLFIYHDVTFMFCRVVYTLPPRGGCEVRVQPVATWTSLLILIKVTEWVYTCITYIYIYIYIQPFIDKYDQWSKSITNGFLDLGKFSMFFQTLGTMLYSRENIPVYGPTIQVSEVLKFTQKWSMGSVWRSFLIFWLIIMSYGQSLSLITIIPTGSNPALNTSHDYGYPRQNSIWRGSVFSTGSRPSGARW